MVPIRSRILDFVEPGPPDVPSDGPPGTPHGPSAATGAPAPGAHRSRLLDYADAAPPPRTGPDGRPGPRPGVPPYHTPVFVPAHPRYVDATDPRGRAVRVPFIAYELFAAAPGTATAAVAFAFTSLERLVAALGDAQPWIATSLGPLAEGMRERGAGVVLDPRPVPGQINWRPADLAAYAREVRG
ncbi:SAV_915 family protein [Streptomyces sp. NPDC047000]|uniref:SAV_915 family protein n=1 Tax=Streptomyces sp. NPDC047000 TaxID=3155474 RepID=UPI0034102158